MTTIVELLKNNQQIDRLDAELIIAHVLNKTREFVIAHTDLKIKRLKNLKIKKLISKRVQGVPLAYLTEHKEFYGLNFLVNKHTLIPRPETEMMVELALSRITYHVSHNTIDKNNKIILIDVGTGSGCIPIAVACHCEESPRGADAAISRQHLRLLRRSAPRNDIKIFTTDISKPALAVARLNAKKHGVKIKFLQGDLLKPISNFKFQISNLVITANLPYLTPEQFKSEPSIQHEPRLALVAGHDGLKYYRQLFKQIKSLLSTLKLYNFITFIEINPSQSKKIKLLIKQHLPHAKIKLYRDLAGKNRIVEVQI